MKIVLVCLLAVAFAEDPLRSVLRSPSATASLYKKMKLMNHVEFPGAEDSLRFRLFRSNAAKVADYNEDPEDTAHYAINKFAFMTPSEKQSYLGVNMTGIPMGPEDTGPKNGVEGPSKLLWTDSGAVTPVKDQARCGSCWTFGAIGALETNYKLKSGVLRNFAEQEYLDCVFERRDGCKGGLERLCYKWSVDNGGRAAATKDYPYRAASGTCKSDSTRNSAIAYKITGSKRIARSERANLEALLEGAVVASLEITDKFFLYDSTIMRDNTCKDYANHSVTMVGYTPTYVLVKNSFGSDWGDRGFVKFARNHNNCQLFQHSVVPLLESTGRQDHSRSDPAVRYKPYDGKPKPMPDDKCPPGTMRCDDGVCRHEHMCFYG